MRTRSQELGFLVGCGGGFRNSRYLFGGPYYKGDPTIWGSILGVPIIANPLCSVDQEGSQHDVSTMLELDQETTSSKAAHQSWLKGVLGKRTEVSVLHCVGTCIGFLGFCPDVFESFDQLI